MVKYILICCLNLFFFKVSAQKISEQIYKEYSPYIITKLYEKVISKMELNTQSQLFLANAYKAQNEQELDFIKRGKTDANEYKRFKDSIDWAIEESFKRTLNIEELKVFDSVIVLSRDYANPIFNDVIVPDAEMNSQFGSAIKFKKILRLRDTQIDSIKNAAILLRNKIKFAKAKPDSGFFDKAAFESERMSEIINDNQYLVLLNEKNKAQSEIQARYLWQALAKRGLEKKFNKQESIKQLVIYYLMKANFTDRFANEKIRRNALIKAIKLPEPLYVFLLSLKTEKEKLEKYAW